MLTKKLTKLKCCLCFVLLALVSNQTAATQAPSFVLPGVKSTVNLVDFRGQVVYVDFWASWCGPCRKSFPWMNQMQSEYGDRGLNVVAINLDQSREAAEAFLEKVPASFTLAFDAEGHTARAFGLKAMPSSYLIGRDGEILFSHIGFRVGDRQKMEAKIKQLVTGL